MSPTLFLTFVLAGSPDPAQLVVSPDQVSKARELVRLLGSDIYRDRDRATRELFKMGRTALPALTSAVDDPDPEVRMRCGWLLPRAEADDMKVRVEAFLADTDARFEHDLPGWRKYRQLAGDDKAARDLFAQIVKQPDNYDILMAVRGIPMPAVDGLAGLVGGLSLTGPDRPPEADLTRALTTRRFGIQARFSTLVAGGGMVVRGQVNPELHEVAILMLAECVLPEQSPIGVINGAQYHVANFFYQPNGREAVLGNGPFGPAVRRLAIQWLETRQGVSGLSNALNIALNLNLGNATVNRYAARMIDAPGAMPWNKAQAANTLARNGAKEYVPAIIRMFTDETLLMKNGPNNPNPDIAVKDNALAMVLLLTGQDPRTYGFDVANPTNHDVMKFNYTHFRFIDDGPTTAEMKRTAAFDRWKEWDASLFGAAAGPAAVLATHARRFPEKLRAVGQ